MALAEAAEPPVLEIEGLRRRFGPVAAVDGISLTVGPGEILSILGPSGCGKTTAMRMIAGLEAPDGGDIRIAGRSVVDTPPHRRNVGLVFQSLAIFPHMPVWRNVAFGLRMQGLRAAAARPQAERMLELVQLPPATFAERMPDQLSGGQLQRVALARTLVTRPAVVLFDEPMAALDRRLRDYMAAELRAIQKRLGIAAIYVTHDQETASTMSDRIAIMAAGRIVQIGTPEAVYERPASRFVADFLGDVSCLPGEVVGVAQGTARIACGAAAFEAAVPAARPGARVTVALRPGHVRLSPLAEPHSFASGVIAAAHFVSGTHRCRVRLGDGQEILVQSPAGEAYAAREGETVSLSAEPAFVRVLPE